MEKVDVEIGLLFTTVILILVGVSYMVDKPKAAEGAKPEASNFQRPC